MPEETSELPVSPQEVQIEPSSLLDKLKLHKFKILAGILGILVFIGAVFGAYRFGQKQIQPVSKPIPTPLSSEAPAKEGDPTANWKTYTNTRAGYQISYPPDWELKENVNSNYPGMIIISPKSATADNMYKGSVNVWPDYSSEKFTNIQDLAKAIQQAEEGVAEYSTEEFRKIGENEFWIAKGGCCMDIGRHAFTLNKLSVYRITLYNLEQSFTDSEIQTFNLMLSTFRFLEASTISPIPK